MSHITACYVPQNNFKSADAYRSQEMQFQTPKMDSGRKRLLSEETEMPDKEEATVSSTP